MHVGGSQGDRGLSWKRQGADEMAECESEKAENEQGGQDMRNLWHQTQLKEKNQTYAVCAVYPEAQPYVT